MPDACGAKTRAGGSCKAPPMENGRCRVHGGPSTGAPKGNTNALKHGIYSKHFTDEELEIAEKIELGDVSNELRLCRIRLRRALDAEEAACGEPELEEVLERDGGGPMVASEERRSRVRDYPKMVDVLLARIESLEKTRAALLRALSGGDEIGDIMRDDTTISPDEPIPNNPIL